jgi:hypothetical protein
VEVENLDIDAILSQFLKIVQNQVIGYKKAHKSHF